MTNNNPENIYTVVEAGLNNNNKEEPSGEASLTAEDKRKRKKRKRRLACLDVLVGGLVICPIGIAAWRGMWNLMDVYGTYFPGGPTSLVGIAMHFVFALVRFPLVEWSCRWSRSCSPIKKWFCGVVRRVYCVVFLLGCIMHWRGFWHIWEAHIGVPLLQDPHYRSGIAIFVTLCLLAALVYTRSLRNTVSIPFAVVVDSCDEAFYFPTRFRQSSGDPMLFVLDCLFSVVVVGSLVVVVWRGVWDFFDCHMFPGDLAWSAFGSLFLGYGLAVITFLMQPLARRICDKLSGIPRLLVADVFLFLSFISTINVWRSIWMLLDNYFMPDDKELSNWVTHGVSMAVLMLLNCANSVLVRGVYIDCEEDGGQCVVFPCYYLRLFFQKERIKKRQRRLEMMAKASALDGDTPHGVIPLLTTNEKANHIIKAAQEDVEEIKK